MTLAPGVEALGLAERAHALVQANPFQAHKLAEVALSRARAQRDVEGRVAALHALGFARVRLGDPRALRTMQAAVRAGERGGFPHRAALARRNVALYLAYRGSADRGVREIEAARAALTGVERARTEVFRIAIFHIAGRASEAWPGSSDALRELRRRGDTAWEARLLYNRGGSLAEVGDAASARRDLERARELYSQLGLAAAVADAQIILARLRLDDGDVLDCLRELEAIDRGELSDWAACWFFLRRAEAYVALRLLPEARIDLERFTEACTRAKAVDPVNKGRLHACQLALLSGEPAAAQSLAETARRSFARRHQPSFAASATLLSLAASVQRDSIRTSRIRAGQRAVSILAETGWTLDALRGRVLVARAAAIAGSRATATRERDAARALEHRGTVIDRIALRHVDGLIRINQRDPRGAERVLRAGLRLLDDYRAALGAVELRATASALGVDLAQLGLRIAIDAARPASVFEWTERLRSNALRLPAVEPPSDAKLRAQQLDLRRVAGQIQAAEQRGRIVRGLTVRQAELETAIRTRTRQLPGNDGVRPAVCRPSDVSRMLGARALVEYVELDGMVRALTLVDHRLELHELGTDAVAAELEWLRFALGRLAHQNLSPERRSATLGSARAAAAVLDRTLIEPLLPTIRDRSVVLVPTGVLHALPWSSLPSLRGRPIVVAPSVSIWLDVVMRAKSRRGKGALIAGPRLRHAAAEVRALSPLFPRAEVLTGKAASGNAALAALDGAALAHVACHGHFRADSPLFSSLELADGPVTALDLQRLRRAPDVLVLSSCDLALSDRRPGDELLGLAAALLGMGTRTIIASVVPVPDSASRRLMLAFHRLLADGRTPSVALAEAQAGLRGDATSLAGFVCLGSG